MFKRDHRPRVGLICCVNNRGLGTEARNLESIFKNHIDDYAFDTYRLPTGRAAHDFDGQWQGNRRFKRWLARQAVVMSIEVFMPRLFEYCRQRDIRCLWRPNQEWIPGDVSASELALAERIVTPQRDCARLLREKFQLDDQIVCIPWILDREVQQKVPQSGPPHFLFNAGRGGVGDRRNTQLVVAGMAMVLARETNIRFTIKTQKKLDVTALEQWRGKSFDYIEKNVSYEANLAWYAKSDFSLAPSKWEGLGFALLESLHAGTPVVTVDAPPMNEWVDHGKTGWLLPAQRADLELPIADDADPSLGLNWVPASLAEPEALAEAVLYLAEHRDAFLANFSDYNTAILAARKTAFLNDFRALLQK